MEPTLKTVNVLGVRINAMTMNDAVSQIRHWIDNSEKHYVSVCTVHTVMECHLDPRMREAVNGASMTTPDGMPLVWLGKYRCKSQSERVYGPDLLLNLSELSAKEGYTQFFYGGKARVPEQLALNLQSRFPGLQVSGCISPPFRPLSNEEEAEMIQAINAAQPDVIWVGLGTPKQDLWMASHRHLLDAPVLVAVGAAFDFHTGRMRQAPRWMQKNGLEWLFRLFSEPRRLWRRYLLYNPWFIYLTILQSLGIRDFPIEP